MIDPKLLTVENGFVEGCVVEYDYHSWGKLENDPLTFHAFFVEMDGDCMIIHDWEAGRGDVDCSLITRIKVLTGPMAIWNFAPEWAQELMIWPFGGKFEWHRIGDERKTIGGNVQFIPRPWWAEVKR